MVDVVAADRPRVEGDRAHLRGPGDDGDLGRADLVRAAARGKLDPRGLARTPAPRAGCASERTRRRRPSRASTGRCRGARPSASARASSAARERAHDAVADRQVVLHDVELRDLGRALAGSGRSRGRGSTRAPPGHRPRRPWRRTWPWHGVLPCVRPPRARRSRSRPGGHSCPAQTRGRRRCRRCSTRSTPTTSTRSWRSSATTASSTRRAGRRREGTGWSARAGAEGISGGFDGIPDIAYEDDRHFSCADRGVSEWTIRGTTAAGEPIEVRGCDLFEFRDGKISRKDSFWKIIE